MAEEEEERSSGDAGHRTYTPGFLRVYDPMVLGFYSNLVWRCPVRELTALYRRAIGPRHLDVGPGTGYFLQRSAREGASLTLLDPNRHVLAHASRRLADWMSITVEADVLQPLPVEGPFESAALNYVLHCLPGPEERKAAAVRNVAAVLDHEGILFGAIVLGERRLHTALSRPVLRYLNDRGIFANLGDTEDGLRHALEDAFAEVHVAIKGSVMTFTAVRPGAKRLHDRSWAKGTRPSRAGQ